MQYVSWLPICTADMYVTMKEPPSADEFARLVSVLRAMLPKEGPINQAIGEAVDQVLASSNE